MSGLPTVLCEIIGGWDCDNVIGDLVQHDKATVDMSLISVIAMYGNKEEQPHRGNVWVSIIHTRFPDSMTTLDQRNILVGHSVGPTLTNYIGPT